MTAEKQLELAKKHLLRVQEAWDPPRWDDLSLYGFYCLENAVTAAATHAKIKDLNDARKSEAYGDVAAPELDAEDVVSQIENYVETVKPFLRKEAP